MTKRSMFYTVFTLCVAMLGFTSCEDEDNDKKLGNWKESSAYFPGTPRASAVCFVIDNVAYVGTGANMGKTEERERYRDFYSCKPTSAKTIAWSPRWDKTGQGVTSMPEAAPARNGGVGFSINGKGYVGLGFDGTRFLRDFWEFDPQGTPDPSQYPSMADDIKSNFTTTGSWKKIADYPGDSCRYAVAFVIDNVAYVGTGEDYDNNMLSDFYKYDGEKWEVIAPIGIPRSEASAFVYNGKGYVVGGKYSGAVDWFQCYDPKQNTWIDLRRIADHEVGDFDDDYNIAAWGCTAFVLNNKAYLTTGGNGYAGTATWEYDPEFDYWIQKTSYERAGRKYAVSFVLDMGVQVEGYPSQMVPYVTTGCNGDIGATGSGGVFYSNTEYFNPYQAYDPRD